MKIKNFVEQIKFIFDFSPFSVYIKDDNFRYHYVNLAALEQLRMRNSDYLMLSDEEMWYSEYSSDYRNHDAAAFQEEIFYQLDCVTSTIGEKFFAFSQKTPLRNENRILGVLGITHYYNTQEHLVQLLSNYDHEKKGLIRITENAQKSLTLKIHDYKLSTRELSCYFYLLHGLSAREVAQKMHISPKTVECHLANIRIKMSCQNKQDLIEKGFQLGLLHGMPMQYYFTSERSELRKTND